VQDRGHLVSDRGHDLRCHRAPADEVAQARPLDVLERQVRPGPVQLRVETADEQRVSQPLQELRLPLEPADGVARQEELRGHRGAPRAVPGQVHLALASGAEAGEHRPRRAERIALPQTPGRLEPELRRGGEASDG
jgi:hypothetical protein